MSLDEIVDVSDVDLSSGGSVNHPIGVHEFVVLSKRDIVLGGVSQEAMQLGVTTPVGTTEVDAIFWKPRDGKDDLRNLFRKIFCVAVDSPVDKAGAPEWIGRRGKAPFCKPKNKPDSNYLSWDWFQVKDYLSQGKTQDDIPF